MSKKGLVLEGGGARGIYTAGVLDVFMERGVTFDGIIGVSAGAIHGVSYVSGQKSAPTIFPVFIRLFIPIKRGSELYFL